MAAVRHGTLTTPGRMFPVITCHLRYEIDPSQTAAFEKYATGWIPVVTRFGGTHHGCYLPHEAMAVGQCGSLWLDSSSTAYAERRSKPYAALCG
jgi:NIPSNAP